MGPKCISEELVVTYIHGTYHSSYICPLQEHLLLECYLSKYGVITTASNNVKRSATTGNLVSG